MSSKILLSAVAALAAVTSASAADLGKGKKAPPAPVVSPWEWTVGAGATTNYVFRGISQSDNQPSVNANAEIRYAINSNYTAYLGAAGSSVKLTNQGAGPSTEWDVIGGLRTTYGAFTVDLGAIGYLYSKTAAGGAFVSTPNWFEGYGKVSYAVNDAFTLGLNAYFTPNFLDTGANGQYISGTAAYKFGDFAVSGEYGRQYLGKTDVAHTPPTTSNRSLPDYAYWNAGVAYSYKIATLDLRYHDTDLSKRECSAITGTTVGGTTANSKYCAAAFVGTLSFALTNKDVK